MNKPFVIGIAGGSGSGKTFFLNCFLHHFTTNQVSLISQDDYYKTIEVQPRDENGWVNFDLPECIEDDKLLRDLSILLSGQPIQKKEYTFNVDKEKARMLTINPAPIIIVEGLFVFHYAELASLFDMKIFMDADEEITLNRRLRRDKKERGYDHDMIMYQWINHVLPAYNSYLLPYKGSADKVITNNSHVADDIIEVTKQLAAELKGSVLVDY
ncbi:uridine kinase [Arcticibacter pallidicorallinus]|uniref:Uridine kinase n=1 Tax=Arcticibacter pallidicorallinus TaxID=1259464 RepID=A0A2T0U3D7_9SPHI|nr:uridine kinase [Arcticibacter pallidicorallinus]PRY52410.1 uridine kinase [Arcticibacter pallidicorallinus]